jgi:2-polyprenyl-6-methoxyphenol hydroxylase-like FAD-dependent oxidoreductase
MGATVDHGKTHAVVMGGSMAGLLAARVLADHFAQVTLLERDVLPHGVAQRRGVPQGHHTHGLLASGRQALDRLFPGFSRELEELGAVPGDIVRDVRWFFEGAPLARPRSGMDGLMATRPFLEAGVRSRVRAIPNVTVRDGCQVAGLSAAHSHDRVTGVRLSTGETLEADLAVDATGRASRSPQWLQSLGYDRPPEERVEIGLGYTTRFFRRAPGHLGGDLGTVVPPTPDGKRGGVMVAQEADRWTVTLISHFVQPAPLDLNGFVAYATMLPSPDIHDVIRCAEPIGDAVSSRFPASVRRRYERLSRFPEGFLVMGDGICSFNPIYGQGMSVAALEALALDDVLAHGMHAVGPRFFKKAAPIVDTPWTTAVGNDLRMPETVGPRSVGVTLINGYMARLQQAAHTDATLAVTFMRVANLLAPATDVLKPSAAWRVLRGTLRRRFGRASAVTAETQVVEGA